MVVTGGTSDRAASGRLSAWGPAAGLLVAGGAVIWAVISAVGYLITRTSFGASIVREDTRISRWFFSERTPRFDTLTHLGTMLSDTLTAIALTVVVVGTLLALRRRQTALVVLVAILGELFVFVLITATVQRARPPVPHLDPAPPTSSFPSGHTAAAVALYVGFAVLLLRSAVRRALAVPAAVLFCLVPVIVGISRLYRGMHYPSDVVFGAIGGGCWLILTLYVLTGPPTQALWRHGSGGRTHEVATSRTG